MPSIENGVTFDLRTSCSGMDDGLQARVHDPLWLLARQWQFGEFGGDDAGTPAHVTMQADEMPLTRYRPGSGAPIDYAPAAVPLESMVESEPLAPAADRHLALLAEAGLHFLRLLAAHGAGQYQAAYRTQYRLARPTAAQAADWDAESLRTVELLAGRVPDSVRLHTDLVAALGPNGGDNRPLPAQPPVAAQDQPRVRSAAQAWLRWFATQNFARPAGTAAWLPERMEYAFAVSARHATDGEMVLAAPEYHGGRLDWDTFVARAGTTLGAQPSSTTTTQRVIPTPVSYPGMPTSRLWAFEDGNVNFGAVEGDRERSLDDLATRVLTEFAMIYGNDWFIAPLEVGVGSLTSLQRLAVVDSFGTEHVVQHYSEVDGANSPWRMFAITPETPAADTPRLRRSLFVAPTLGPGLESAAMEEVLFLRDEMANMAWAVERTVQGRIGQRVDRYEQYQRQRQKEQDEQAAGAGEPVRIAELAYRLGTEVPHFWIPLLPEQDTTTTPGRLLLRLKRGAMPRFGPTGIEGTVPPAGTLLQPGRELALFEEEVPREGARVTRSCQLARWSDGSTFLWIAARKRPGRGEGSSGLRFDTVEPTR